MWGVTALNFVPKVLILIENRQKLEVWPFLGPVESSITWFALHRLSIGTLKLVRIFEDKFEVDTTKFNKITTILDSLSRIAQYCICWTLLVAMLWYLWVANVLPWIFLVEVSDKTASLWILTFSEKNVRDGTLPLLWLSLLPVVDTPRPRTKTLTGFRWWGYLVGAWLNSSSSTWFSRLWGTWSKWSDDQAFRKMAYWCLELM